MVIKVFGHKAPDTDTVCSAIAYAWFLNQKDLDATAYRLGKLNKETEFVLDKFGVESPEFLEDVKKGDKLIIVDTNNPDELPDSLAIADVIQIVDHHKLVGGVKTDVPIPVIIKPFASTATIIWKHIKHSGIKLDKSIAGILLAAIISDTLNLTSPTTTEKDIGSVKELVAITGVKVDELASKMLDAKGNLTGMSAKDVLLVDSKIYDLGGKKVRISVLETPKPQNALDIIEGLKKEKENLKFEGNVDMIYFFAIDILNSKATLVSGTEEENKLAEEAFKTKFDGDTMEIKEVVSRKKQIIPALEPVFEK